MVSEQKTSHQEPLVLFAENEKDQFTLNGNDLYYIESSDNYCTVVYAEEGVLKKHLLRSSLTRIENQLDSQKFVRTHRSYIANISKVASVSGNAQGYKLNLNQFDLQIPVARKYSFVIERLRA